MRSRRPALRAAVMVCVASASARCSSPTNLGGPSALLLVTGDQQAAPAGQPLAQPLVVKVGLGHSLVTNLTTAPGPGAAGVTVAFAPQSGGGSVSASSVTTDARGQASVTWTLGPEPGPQTVSAAVQGLTGSPVTFTATATPNGTISGTITATPGFLAPPRPPALSAGQRRRAGLGLLLAGTPWFVAQPAPANPRGAIAIPRSPPGYTAHDLIVTFRPSAFGAPPLGSRSLAAPAMVQAVGAAMRQRLAGLVPPASDVAGVSPAILAARIRVADSTQRDAVMALLRTDPAIASVTRNGLIALDATETEPVAALTAPTIPNDPFYPLQAWHYGLVDLPRAWSLSTGNAAVLVAVVDQGIRFDHPALAANLTSDGYDFVSSQLVPLCSGGGSINNDGDGDSGYDPDPTQPANYSYNASRNCATPQAIGAHGVHVAGTIGAVGNDAVGVTGVNWTVKIRPVRVLGVTGVGTTYDIAQGILYAAGLPADNGAGGTVQPSTPAKVINLSLGGGDDPTMHSAVIAATNAGVLVVAAAGNSASSTAFFPAAYPEVLAVSAVGPGASLAFYSNFGSYIGIAAPGGDASVGDSSDEVFSTLWNFGTSAPAYGALQGTSMATPHVTGVAALVWALNPSLTAAQVRARLTTYAVNLGSATQYGAGLVNAYNSLTQTAGPPRQLYARLYDASTGAIVATVPAQPGGAYALTHLRDGQYLVYGGTDESADQALGLPGRLWGAWGSTAQPSVVTVAGAGTYPASFAVGLPTELDPNNSFGNANVVMIGGYIHGRIAVANPAVPDDMYRVLVPQSGTYTFETTGWVGACGFALEENTVITLYDAAGATLASNDDIDVTRYNYCSKITTSLSAGTYFLGVAGYHGRRYRLQVRAGP